MQEIVIGGESDVTLPNTGVIAYPNMVNDPSAQADSAGHKYILAGTPLTAPQDTLNNPNNQQQPIMTPTNNASQVQGILRYTVDVTNGSAKAAVVNGGTINTNLMDQTIAQIYSASFRNQLKTALPRLNVITRK